MANYDWMKPHHRPKTTVASIVGSNVSAPVTTVADAIEEMTIVEVLKAVDAGVYAVAEALDAEIARRSRTTLVQQLNDRLA